MNCTDKNYYRNRKDNIINFDSQGWDLHKMNIRDIISTFMKCINGKWEIEDDNSILDVYPNVFEDDGMGYGVNEKNIIEFNPFESSGKQQINIFVEPSLEDISKWLNCRFYPGASVTIKKFKEDNFNFIRDVEEKNGQFIYLVETFISKNGKYISQGIKKYKESDLDWN